MQAEGVVFRTGTKWACTVPMDMLLAGYDAVVLTGGAEGRATGSDGRESFRHLFRDGFPDAAEQARGGRS
jgi:NADPH-dependent glutamate synthase beta subunit-like oxidoreductase